MRGREVRRSPASGRGAQMTLAFGIAVAVAACGGSDESTPAPSGGSMTTERPAPEASGSVGNQAPEIRSIRFEPAEPRGGETLRALVDAADPDGDPIEIGYNWEAGGRRLASNGPTVAVPDLPRGSRISLRVVAGDGKSTSAPVQQEVEIANTPPSLLEIVVHPLSGGNDAGIWRVEPVAEDPDGDRVDFRYRWTVNGRTLDEDGNSLTRAGWKRGDEIRVEVVATDGRSETRPVMSAPIVIGNSPPEITSRPPPIDPSGLFKYQVEATDPDGDRGPRFSLGKAPEGMTIDPFSGEVVWRATLKDAGEHQVDVIVSDRSGGESRQSFFVAVRASTEPGKEAPPAAAAP